MLATNRLEAFSDGVLAVIITITVLALPVPAGRDFSALASVWPTAATYALSFTYIAIYWVNHHHLIKAAESIDGRTMWANLHLLFWLSFVPFVTAWLGAHPEAPVPALIYGIVLFCAATAYSLLTYAIVACNGRQSRVARALRRDWKQIASIALYLLAIAVSFFVPRISEICFVAVALLWIIPERRLERELRSGNP